MTLARQLLAALLAAFALAAQAADSAAGRGIVASYDADTDTSYLVARPTLGEGFFFHRPVRPRCLNLPVGVLIPRATFAALATAQSVILHMEGKAFTFGAADRALLRDFSARIEALGPAQEAALAAPARTGPDVFPADPS